MTADTDLKDIVLRLQDEHNQLRRDVSGVLAKERKVQRACQETRHRLQTALASFDRDRYKAADQRLAIVALANELLIFDRLGYPREEDGAAFIFGVEATLDGRGRDALEYLDRFRGQPSPEASRYRDACYIAGMITYNRWECQRSSEYLLAAFDHSRSENRDWPSKIYEGELVFFLRKPPREVERFFQRAEEGMILP